MRKGVVVGVVAALVVIAAILVAARQAVIAALLPRVIGIATGYDLTIGDERFSANHAALLHVHVSKNGEPVLDAQRIDVSYSLRDLLPGSRHRYGVNAIDVDHPYLTIVRHKDGTYNVAIPQGGGAAPIAPQAVNRVPIALDVRIRNAAGEVRAPYVLDPSARSLKVHGVNLDAAIDSDTLTQYRLTGAFIEHPDEPFTVRGTIDVNRGYAMHHAFAAALPMRAIANYFINSSAARILGGTATNFDARMYSLDVQRSAPIEYHTGLTLDVANGGIAIVGLAQPLGDIRGELKLVDDAFFINDVAGTLAGIPVRITGGIYDFAAPQYRLGISATGDLTRLRTVFGFAKHQPVKGSARIGVLVEGPLDSPLIAANADASDVAFSSVPLHDVHAKIAYYNGNVFFSPLRAQTQGARLSVRGLLSTGNVVHTEAAFHMSAPADRLPYAGELLGSEPLVADALLDGHDTTFHAEGALASMNGSDRVAARFLFEPNGIVNVAPLWLETNHGSLAGAYHLDRAHNTSAFWLSAQGFTLRTPAHTSFLDVTLPSIPQIDATVDDVALEGGGPSGSNAVVAGSLAARDARIAGVRIDRLAAKFAGSVASAAIAPARASGPWGTIDGTGQYANTALTIRGEYHGTLGGLRPFLGNVPAQGTIDGPVALGIAPSRITVQADNVALHGANVRGLPLARVAGTIAFTNGVLHVYSARAAAAGGDVVAAGDYDTTDRDARRSLALVATGLQAAGLHGLGLPLDAGHVYANGRLGGASPLPRFDGGVAVAGGRVQHYAVAGSALVHLGGDGAHLDHVVAGLDGNYALAKGDLAALTSGDPRYTLTADVAAADVGRTLHMLQLPSFASDGTFNGAFAIGGRGLAPSVRGPINVPAGSVNGLPFTDARATISADRNGAIARRGSVLVETTHVTFAAAKAPFISGVHIRAPAADLSDFNNFFDTGDTLDGTGTVDFNVVSQRHRLISNGNINVKALRYRNLAIGDTRAVWSSRRNFLQGSLVVTGENGTLHSHGNIALAPNELWQHVLRDSRYNLNLDVDDLDLSTWVAALGFPQVPITGKVNSDATIKGSFPQLELRGTAALHNGTVWRLPLDSFDLAFSSNARRLRIDKADLIAPGVDATASGSFGLSKSAPLDLDVHASSNDLPRLIAQLWRYQVPVTGVFESTVHVGGDFARPTFDAAFDASNVEAYNIKVLSAFGELRLRDRALELRNAGVAFEKGEATLAGSLPLQLSPFSVGPARAPVSFDLALSGVDPANFQTLLGSATKLGGTIDGQVGLSGTVAQPRIFGQFAIAKGSYVERLRAHADYRYRRVAHVQPNRSVAEQTTRPAGNRQS